MVPLYREVEYGPRPAIAPGKGPRASRPEPEQSGVPRFDGGEADDPVAVADFGVHARAALRAEGYRMTQQRESLLRLIARNTGHLEAVALHDLARRDHPRISLSTVYRTLSLLKRHDLVAEVHLNEEHHHYEAKMGEAHYHLVCRECGGVEEFGADVVEAMREAFRRDFGFVVHGMDLDVTGTCRRCIA